MNEIGLFPAFAREIFQRVGILDERSSALFFALFSAGSFVLSPCVECLVFKLLGRLRNSPVLCVSKLRRVPEGSGVVFPWQATLRE